MLRILAAVLLLMFAANLHADWPAFRGPSYSGATDAGNPPVEWSREKNVAWIAELPGEGYSQPVVADGRVYVTGTSGADNDRLHVVCYDDASGKELWNRQFWATGPTMVNSDNRVAVSSPVIGDGRVYATFSSNDVICLNRDGLLLWYRGLSYDHPNIRNSLGMGSSLAYAAGTLAVQTETDDASFAFGLDGETGLDRWKISRPRKANWSSPVPMEREGQTAFVLQSPSGVTAVAAKTGETLFEFDGGGSSMSSVTPAGERLLVPADGVTALRIASSGQVEVDWNNKKLNCNYVSPTVYRDKIYTINSSGVLTCAGLEDGETLWQLRLGGSYWGSPAAAAGHIYCPAKDGTIKVVDVTGDEGKIVAENPLGAETATPPAISGDAIYLRTDRALWKVANFSNAR